MTSTNDDEGVVYQTVTSGTRWKRLICWLLGHQKQQAVGVELCSRCNHKRTTEFADEFR